MFKGIKIRLLLLIALFIILQISVLPFLSFGPIGLDLFVIFFVLISLKYPARYTFYISLLFGLIKELFSSHYFGVELIPFLIIGLLLPQIINKLNVNFKIIRLLLIFLFATIFFSLNIFCFALAEQSTEVLQSFFFKIINSSIYTAFASIFLEKIINIVLPKRSIQYELF
jgi:rod shape-determining protein MreD